MGSGLSPEYLAILRRMTGQQKLRTAFALYWAARKLKASALRSLNPHWSGVEIEEKVKEIFIHAKS
jgi:hypothetical protein